jgi:hypothetical protein
MTGHKNTISSEFSPPIKVQVKKTTIPPGTKKIPIFGGNSPTPRKKKSPFNPNIVVPQAINQQITPITVEEHFSSGSLQDIESLKSKLTPD